MLASKFFRCSILCSVVWLVESIALGKNALRGQSHVESESLRSILQLTTVSDARRQMLTVHIMGGLGNQLFQVAALLSFALESPAPVSIALPSIQHVCCNRSTYWDSVFHKLQPLLLQNLQESGNVNSSWKVKPTSQSCTLEQVRGFDPYDDDCTDATAFNQSWTKALTNRTECKNITLFGYFQNPIFFAKHLPLYRNIFWDDSVASTASALLAKIFPGAGHDRPVVSIHYRLSDYDQNGWVLDQDYYNAALSQASALLARRQPRCIIFSDDPQRAWTRSASLDGCVEKVLAPSHIDTATTFHLMSLAQGSIIADSTFSYWAALLGNLKEFVIAPDLTGPRKRCWSYLQNPPSSLHAKWVMVPAKILSSQELFAEELLELPPPVS